MHKQIILRDRPEQKLETGPKRNKRAHVNKKLESEHIFREGKGHEEEGNTNIMDPDLLPACEVKSPWIETRGIYGWSLEHREQLRSKLGHGN